MVIYASTIEIGNYGVALNFAVLANFLTGPISTMLFPFFSRFKKEDPTLQILYQDSVKYVSLITLPGAFALIALADTMITIIYSNGYALATNFLRLYLIGYLFAGLGSISNGNLLNGQGRADVNLRCSIITLIIGGIMSLYMIPNYSIIGLIITMITAPEDFRKTADGPTRDQASEGYRGAADRLTQEQPRTGYRGIPGRTTRSRAKEGFGTAADKPVREGTAEGTKKVSKRPPRGRVKDKSGTVKSRTPRKETKDVS